jgi:hypothetical protein
MGILKTHLHILAMEHKNYPIRGKVLVISQQAVYATLDETVSIYKRHGVPMKTLPEGFDTKNKIPIWKGTTRGNFTNCKTLMVLLGAEDVQVCDVSEYEGPDFLLNLNKPANPRHHNQFDAIICFATLEHTFDVPQALENLNLMLKKGGILACMTPVAMMNHGFYSIHPTLYLDYFKTNGFKDFSFYLMNDNGGSCRGPHDVFRLDSKMAGTALCHLTKASEVVFFARKPQDYVFSNSRDIVQTEYTSDSGWASGGKEESGNKSSSRMKKMFWSLPPSVRDRIPYDSAAELYAKLKHPGLARPVRIGRF